jgi:hypothetical protein
MIITPNHYDPPNLVSKTGPLERVLQLKPKSCRVGRYMPMYCYSKEGNIRIKGYSAIYHFGDPECGALYDFMFQGIGGLPGFPLKLTNSAEDVRFRQEAVRELSENPRLLDLCQRIMEDNVGDSLKLLELKRGSFEMGKLNVYASPEKIDRLLEQMRDLGQNASSEALRRCTEWADKIRGDSLFQEHYKKKRRIGDSRVIAAYSERYGGVRYGLLKPGVNFDDLVDILEPRVTAHTTTRSTRGGNLREEVKHVVKFRHPFEKDEAEHVLYQGRQRMDVLNQITSQMLGIPAYLALAQIRHLQLGALMYLQMKEAGIAPVFPDILDQPSTILARKMLPVRLVLKEIQTAHPLPKSLEAMCPNDFDFSFEDDIMQIEGANARGKSEAWRSIHLFINLANAGFPVPAKAAAYGPINASHFISCKGKEHHGGSEFQYSAQNILTRICRVHSGEAVILDELGDATNGPTGRLAAERLVPFLRDKGCKVFVTTHNDSVGQYIQSIGARCFTTSHTPKGRNIFRIQPKTGKAEYFPERTLDDIEFTRERLEINFDNELLSEKIRAESRGSEEDDKEDEENDDDLPF